MQFWVRWDLRVKVYSLRTKLTARLFRMKDYALNNITVVDGQIVATNAEGVPLYQFVEGEWRQAPIRIPAELEAEWLAAGYPADYRETGRVKSMMIEVDGQMREMYVVRYGWSVICTDKEMANETGIYGAGGTI